MKISFAAKPTRIAVLALASLLSGCSMLGGLFSSDKVDYRTAAKTKPLDVPPDLSQLARESRFQPQGGVISASSGAGSISAAGTAAAGVAALQPVAQISAGAMRVERAGQQRWLVVPLAPEQVWPSLRSFWEQRGFRIEVEDAKVGVMETNWSENRGKLPADAVRNVIGRLVGNLYDTGERDKYRTRVERTATGSEIYIAHRGAEEVYVTERRDSTTWRGRANDPALEAQYLAQLMFALSSPSGRDEPARPAQSTTAALPIAAAVAAVAATPDQPPKARALGSSGTMLEIDDPFDRAWRRVGLALDRGGFTVEDRDRAGGLYYVRYVDPKTAGREEPGFFARLFSDRSNPLAAVRYRVALKAAGEKTTVTVLTSAGGAEVGDNGRQIAARLVTELR